MFQGQESRIRDSPSVQVSIILILVYLVSGWVGGDFLDPFGNLNSPGYYFVQINPLVWQGWVWMLFTSLLLHSSPLHLGGNVLFLLIFGTVLEEQVSRKRWFLTFLISGIAGNIAFLFFGPLLGQQVGLGASGAIYGLLGAAGGAKGAAAMIFLLGLNLFAGGGELAHAFGLLAGILIHHWGDAVSRILSRWSFSTSY